MPAKFGVRLWAVLLGCVCLLGGPLKTRAFALLGPIQPWMQITNGVYDPNADIGGPMCLSNGYRWNVPVITYGFDQSFLDYFGTNGVAAVEGAIQILNDLPPASQMVLTNYPFDSQLVNYAAQASLSYDLKSQTLSLLLEHMGLAQPTRYIFVLQSWNQSLFNYAAPYHEFEADFFGNPMGSNLFGLSESSFGADSSSNALDFVIERNYDPQTLNWTPYVNDIVYYGDLESDSSGFSGIISIAGNPLGNSYTAVADLNTEANSDYFQLGNSSAGYFYTGLTYDDAGGLRYLLSTNNVNFETLLPGVVGAGTNSNAFVNGAWRPGTDKVTFVPQPLDPQSGAFLPTTNFYTDTYFTNGILKRQQLARVVTNPDFIFSAGDPGTIPNPMFVRTGTANWLNNATANGNTNGAGPGVIQPPVQIVFSKLGGQYFTHGQGSSDLEAENGSQYWSSYDGSTNAPIIYPTQKAGTNQMTVRMWLIFGSNFNEYEWHPFSLQGAQFAMQTSTNLTGWTTLFTVSNNGSICTYFNAPASPTRFYQLVPQ